MCVSLPPARAVLAGHPGLLQDLWTGLSLVLSGLRSLDMMAEERNKMLDSSFFAIIFQTSKLAEPCTRQGVQYKADHMSVLWNYDVIINHALQPWLKLTERLFGMGGRRRDGSMFALHCMHGELLPALFHHIAIVDDD